MTVSARSPALPPAHRDSPRPAARCRRPGRRRRPLRPQIASARPCTGRSQPWPTSSATRLPMPHRTRRRCAMIPPRSAAALSRPTRRWPRSAPVWPTSAGRSPRRETPCASRRSWSSSAAGSPTPRRQTPPWSWRPRPCAAPTRRSAHVFPGTADQMYLALRLAMCRRLLPPDAPMVLDDALVNFDPVRTRAALRVLREEPRQILLFTCRPLTQEEE